MEATKALSQSAWDLLTLVYGYFPLCSYDTFFSSILFCFHKGLVEFYGQKGTLSSPCLTAE